MARLVSILLHVLPVACWALLLCGGKPLDSNAKVCRNIEISYRNPNPNIEELRDHLRRLVGGCQLVNGDVTIKDFGVDPISENPLDGNFWTMESDFLDSIEEIEGRLQIFRVNVERLIFRNLKVIRGRIMQDRMHREHRAMEIIQLRLPVRLQFPKLTAIGTGSVVLIGVVHPDTYCHLEHQIDWLLLFRGHADGEVQVFINEAKKVSDCSKSLACSKECGGSTGQPAICWSGGSGGCQSTLNRCLATQCGNALCHRDPKTGAETCCHRTCLGGCSGPGPEHCDSCKVVSRDGTCDDSCRHGQTALFQMESLCVKTCPMPYTQGSSVPFRDKCLLRCPHYEIPRNGVCTPCADCNDLCMVKIIYSDEEAQNLMANKCHLLSSPFYFLDVNAAHLKNKQSLLPLAGMRAFYGELLVKRIDKLGATGLEFLRNLEFVSETLVIMLMQVRFLGLAKLQRAGLVRLIRLTGLCRAWYPRDHVDKLRQRFTFREEGVTFDDTGEVCKAAACDISCGGAGKCWGPGPEMCVAN